MKPNICFKFYLETVFIISLYSFINSASIYYEKPSSARLAAASHTPPACTYQNQKYAHGQQVSTPEPCLNCTCKKGVLLCFLRVCPTLMQVSPHDNCITVRQAGQCCPTLRCDTSTTMTTSEPSLTTVTNGKFTKLLESDMTSSNNITTASTYNRSQVSSNTPPFTFTTRKPLRTENVTLHYSTVASNSEELVASRGPTRDGNGVTITQKDGITTILQTSPSTTFHDSLLLVTSSPNLSLTQDNDYLINSIEGSCLINGTLYAEGSAVISTSFCEYCYCIRSKRMCIRPRCHLSIMGCLPRYTSEYACCPTSYVCGEQALTTIPFTTTTTSTHSTVYGRKSTCFIDGIHYQVGDAIPSDQDCKQCYCSTGAVKKCKKILCSPPMDGCVPIVPDGHCCPVEYKCNSTQRSVVDNVDSKMELPFSAINQTTQTEDTTIFSVDLVSSLDSSTTANTIDTETESNTFDAQLSNKFNIHTINFNSTEATIIKSTLLSAPNQSLPQLSNSGNNNSDLKGHQLRINDIIEENNVTNGNDVNKSVTVIVGNLTQNYEPLDSTTIAIEITANDSNDGVYLNTENYESEPTLLYSGLLSDNNSLNMNSESTTEIQILEVSDLSNSTQSVLLETIVTENTIQSSTLNPELNDENTNSTANETTYDKVGDFLQAVIDAIDNNLHHSSNSETRSSVGDKNSNDISNLNTKSSPDLIKPPTSRSQIDAGVSSSLLIADDDHNSPYQSNGGVEIITSKTPFHDMHNSGDSILINLTPSSLRVAPLSSAHLNPSNDRHIQTLAQNNRAPIYGKPISPNYSHNSNLMPSNNWRIVNTNMQRKPQFEDITSSQNQHKSFESLYYNGNIRRHDTEESDNNDEKELDKKARIDIENGSDSQRTRVMPFKINDGVGGLSLNRKNGSFIIRLTAAPKVTSAPKVTQQISCNYNSQEYPNGAMIPKSDPCTLCRCFYGRELCQEQKCPSAPENNCTPEKVVGYCCPRYICRITEEKQRINNITISQSDALSSLETSSIPTIRKGPQYPSTSHSMINTNDNHFERNKTEISSSDKLPLNVNNFDDMSSKEENMRFYQSVPDMPAVPPHVHGLQSKYPSFPLDPTPKPYHKINTYNHNVNRQTENRIHFPLNTNLESDPLINIQPPRSDSISPLIPARPRPSPTLLRPFPVQHNNGANKYRIKPSINSLPSSSSPIINIHKAGQRLPPFLLNSMPNANANQAPNNIHNKQNDVHIYNSHSTSSPQAKPVSNPEISNSSIKTNDSAIKLHEKVLSKNVSSDIEIPKKKLTNVVSSSTPSSFNLNNYYSSRNSSQFDIDLISSTTGSSINLLKTTVNSVTENIKTTPKIKMTTIVTTPKTFTTSISSISAHQTKLTEDNNKNSTKNNWDLFKVSGCNVYGTTYKIDEEISKLSDRCKRCVCSFVGVKCDNIC